MTNPDIKLILAKLSAAVQADQDHDRSRRHVGDRVMDRCASRAGKRIDKRDAAAIELDLNGGKTYEQMREVRAAGNVPTYMWRCELRTDAFWSAKELEFWHTDPEHAFGWRNRFGIKLPTTMTWDADALIGLNQHQYVTIPNNITKRNLLLGTNGRPSDALVALARATHAIEIARRDLSGLLSDGVFAPSMYALSSLIDKLVEVE